VCVCVRVFACVCQLVCELCGIDCNIVPFAWQRFRHCNGVCVCDRSMCVRVRVCIYLCVSVCVCLCVVWYGEWAF